MGLMGRFSGFTKEVIQKEPVVDLTVEGKTKIDKLEGGGPDFMVMIKLAERGPCDAKEIATSTGMDVEKVKAVVNQLGRKGFVKRTN